MKRWHLTFGLTALALGAALIAPRLGGWWPTSEGDEAPPEPRPLIPEVAPVIPEVPPPPAEPTGHLVVDVGFDQAAVLSAGASERFVTVLVSAPDDIGRATRRPVDLSVVMDTSGSMSARGKIDQARRAAKLLASRMGPGDSYSLTVFNDDALVVVPRTFVDDPTRIHLAIDRIYEGGGTNLYAGLERGANEVRKERREGSAQRVVVLSDGNANVGVTDPDTLTRFAADLASSGVALSMVGLGLDYNEDLLGRLADVGGGSYDFVDDASELDRVFAEELDRVASVVATGTTLTLDLPSGVVPVEVIGWDARSTGAGWEVFVGDVYAGETKKIVARVRVDGSALSAGGYDCDRAGGDCGPLVAGAATYQDVVDGHGAVSRDDAQLVVTSQAYRLAESVDRKRAAEVSRAVGAKYLEMSTRAWAEGDKARSDELVEQGARWVRERSVELAVPEAAAPAAQLEQTIGELDALSPTSDDGRRKIKMNKEVYREQSR